MTANIFDTCRIISLLFIPIFFLKKVYKLMINHYKFRLHNPFSHLFLKDDY